MDRIYFEPPSSIMQVIENQTAGMSRDLQQAQKKIKDLHSDKSILQDQVCFDQLDFYLDLNIYIFQVTRRDAEIERLKSQLGEGMPMKRLVQSKGFVEDEIAKLKSQLKGLILCRNQNTELNGGVFFLI